MTLRDNCCTYNGALMDNHLFFRVWNKKDKHKLTGGYQGMLGL